ncbi:MAG TPA: hypothetical protein VGA52_16040 [Anaerolineales bacterium]|jgi:hypothetical protein
MVQPAKEERVPGYRLDQTLTAVGRFRQSWNRYHRPDDVSHLLRLFRKVSLQRGYELDYLPMRRGDMRWIWPFARLSQPGSPTEPPPALRAIPPDRLAAEKRGGSLHMIEIETLYRHLAYEHSAEGLAEYAFFLNELWATKAPEREAAWLAIEPLVVRHAFDAVLRREAKNLVRVARPVAFDPLAILGEAGGTLSFLAFEAGPWKRIVRIELTVEADGAVAWEPVEVVASLKG